MVYKKTKKKALASIKLETLFPLFFWAFSISHLVLSAIMTSYQRAILCHLCLWDIAVIDPSLGSCLYLVAISNRHKQNGLSTAQPIAFTWVCACMRMSRCLLCVYIHSSMCVWELELEPQHCGCVAFVSFVCAMFLHFSIFHGRRSITNIYPYTQKGINFTFLSDRACCLQAISRKTNQCSFDWEGLLPLCCLISTRSLIMYIP